MISSGLVARVSGLFDRVGDGFHDAWLALLLLLGGRLARHVRVEDAGRAALGAVVLAGLGSALLTLIHEIPRPATAPDVYRWPWEHASPAFAVATVLGYAFPTWASLLTLGALVAGVARVYQRTHVLVDVVVGGLLGTAAGVVLARGLLRPAPLARAPIGWGLVLVAVTVAVPMVAFFAAYERALAAHQSSDAGSVGTSPGVVLVQFGTEQARARLGPGWSKDETWKGTFPMIWAEGLEAGLVVPGLSAADHRFRLHLLPFVAPGRPPCQSMAVSVNGQMTAALRLDTRWRWYEIRVPRQMLRADRNEVGFRFARADRPRDYGRRSTDSRALSVAFAVLEAVPVDP